jgi:phosphatidylethanolamine-binding protein (PEBP) family uncharacterized protein
MNAPAARKFKECSLLLLVGAFFVLQGCAEERGPATINDASPLRNSISSRLTVQTPALKNDQTLEKLPIRYRCSENAIWFPLEWGSVPDPTDEIVVTVIANTLYRKGNAVASRLYTAWVIGGIQPEVHTLHPGQLPPGVFLTGRNVNSPNCPPRSQETGFVFTVNALPEGRDHQNFESIGLSTIEALEAEALAKGHVLAAYGNR